MSNLTTTVHVCPHNLGKPADEIQSILDRCDGCEVALGQGEEIPMHSRKIPVPPDVANLVVINMDDAAGFGE